MKDLYILNKQRQPVPVEDLEKWGRFMGTKTRIVAKTKVGDIEVSTVFLGLDHNFVGKGPPILWETMVFGGPHDQEWMDRCSGTWEQAEAMHAKMIKRVMKDK